MILRFMLCHDSRFPQFYSPYPDPRFFIGAPTRDQVKRIYWSDIKTLIPKAFLAKPPNESNLVVCGINGAELHLMGLDKPERIEGSPWDHACIDEIANVKPTAWPENIRPALSDRKGGCDFIGVPEGRNHYFDLYEDARLDMEDPEGEWAAFTWTASDVLPRYGRAEEVESAKKYLDALVYQQEYEASFVNFSGMAYYNFDEKIHVGNYRQFYNPQKPIEICFDFNVSPGIAVICQEMGADVFDIPPGQTITACIGEVHIPRQSNTKVVCNKIIKDWRNHMGLILCYGDSTGGAKGSAKIKGSDWDIIKSTLYPEFGTQLFFNVPKANPRERQRVNAVNSRFVSYDGVVRMVLDGKYCPMLKKDFEGTRTIEGSAGEIDKKSDPMLTHMSDSVGYYIHKEYPVAKYYKKDTIDQMYENRRRRG
ncbi:MAG: hypothetical protein GY751_10755 [Bacteroidetes bacterium]|nr:hypothetical protein [Bacteroidota bacterium]